ncbi:hypothetical protein CO683_00710 [Bradyrhizobium ottawaense]|uniref:hypothetical protein n=1 Tax=Bradyrhizobium ottawaense TaxID=931866 RepID=UPI000BE7A37D|nr:hypothetical protein [Bradyrhizobium ottawaense]PDT71713.1 hypothetical protein CO683_00710 [Bradyrhizobium ottawaense]
MTARDFGIMTRKSEFTSRQDIGRFDRPAGSRGAVTKYNSGAENSYLFPPDPHGLSTRALLKRGYVAEALIDSSALLFCFLFLCVLGGALPLACFLMIFAKFH